MQERYGIEVTPDLYSRLRAQVRHGRASFVCKTNNRLSVFTVRVDNKRIPVVYDRLRGTLVTALPQQ